MGLSIPANDIFPLEREHFKVKSERLSSITIDSLPARGTLIYNDNPVKNIGISVSAIDILIGSLAYWPAPGETGNSYATFDYTSHSTSGLTSNEFIIFDVNQPNS